MKISCALVCKSFFEWSSNSLQCAAAKLQTQHCCMSTRSTCVYRDWFSFGWPLRRCQVTLVHSDIQVAARSVGCISCVRALDVSMRKRGWPKCTEAISSIQGWGQPRSQGFLPHFEWRTAPSKSGKKPWERGWSEVAFSLNNLQTLRNSDLLRSKYQIMPPTPPPGCWTVLWPWRYWKISVTNYR